MSLRKGFTLLELLLVIALLAILSSAIGPSFVSTSRLSIDASRQQKFIANYQALKLAADYYLMASDSTREIRNNNLFQHAGQSNAGSPGVGPYTGLQLLIASGVLQLDTCEYERIDGTRRFFRMAVGDDVGNASTTVQLWDAFSGGNTITITGFANGQVEAYLRSGKTITELWEDIKTK